MKPVFHLKINKINELRLTRVFLLVGLFLLISGKGWGQVLSSSPTALPITVCAGASVQLNAAASGGSGSYTYIWSSDPVEFTSTIGNPIVNPTVTTIYMVEVSDGFTTVNSQVTVTVNPLPADITGTMNVCAGSSVTLSSATSGGTWSSGTLSIATINAGSGVVTGVLAGTSVITYTLGTGCFVTKPVTVNALPATSLIYHQ